MNIVIPVCNIDKIENQTILLDFAESRIAENPRPFIPQTDAILKVCNRGKSHEKFTEIKNIG